MTTAHPWSARVAAARQLIVDALGVGSDGVGSDGVVAPAAGTVLDGVDRIDLALAEAAGDLQGLENAIEQLDERAATVQLKTALRARPDPTAPDTPLIGSLRQRRHSFHTLVNRRRALLEDVEQSLTDLDTLAARCLEHAHERRPDRFDRSALADEVQRLDQDLAALAEAHRELDRLDGLTGRPGPAM